MSGIRSMDLTFLGEEVLSVITRKRDESSVFYKKVSEIVKGFSG